VCGAIMDKMNSERLIELAETAGEISPTAEEQKLLAGDAALRKELEGLTGLFSDLRSLPEEKIDSAAQAAILPAVREGMARIKRRSPLAWIAAKPAFAHLAAVAASVLLVAGIFFLTLPHGSREALPPDFDDPENLALALGISGSDLLHEAAIWEDIDLLPEFQELTDSESASEYLERDTRELMETAANLDDQLFSQLNELLGREGR